MSYADHSRFLRWLRPLTSTSAAVGRGRAAGREAVRLARASRTASHEWTVRADHRLRASEAPFTFADLAAGAATSRVVSAGRRAAAAFARTWHASRVVSAVGGQGRRLADAWTPAVVCPAAWLTIVAMTTHIALWFFADPYRFPSYGEVALPATVLALAIAALLGHRVIARAWQDRRSR